MGVRFQFDPHFREAFENVPHTVLGKRLEPYSIWHRYCLEMLDSPVLTGDPIDKIHLLGAVIVCRSRFDGTGYVPTFPKARGLLRRMWIGLRLGRYNLRKEVEKFSDYLLDFHSPPKLWPDEDAPQNVTFSEIDPLLDLVAHLVSKGIAPADAWNMPLGMANWYSVVFLKLDGRQGVDVWTPHDQVAYEKHVQEREKKLTAQTQALADAEGIPLAQARERVEKEYWEGVKQRRAEAKALEAAQARLGARIPGMAGGGLF